MLHGCQPCRSQQLSSRPGIHLQGGGSHKAPMVLSSCPKGAGGHCMAASLNPSGHGCRHWGEHSSLLLLYLPITGSPCHHWGREWAGNITRHCCIHTAQPSLTEQGSTSEARDAWFFLQPGSCRNPALSSHMGPKQVLKPWTLITNHSSAALSPLLCSLASFN